MITLKLISIIVWNILIIIIGIKAIDMFLKNDEI
jgi:hypothetical protein